jgi:anti-sigma B factor antagonist
MPATAQLTTEVERVAPAVSVVAVRGEINAGSEELLMAAYAKATEDGVAAPVLDFGGLAYMNSGGIGLLMTMLIRAQRQNVQLLASGLSDHYRQIFELTRLDEAIGIYDDRQAAVDVAQQRRQQ